MKEKLTEQYSFKVVDSVHERLMQYLKDTNRKLPDVLREAVDYFLTTEANGKDRPTG